jgi:hypothetical protein
LGVELTTPPRKKHYYHDTSKKKKVKSHPGMYSLWKMNKVQRIKSGTQFLIAREKVILKTKTKNSLSHIKDRLHKCT